MLDNLPRNSIIKGTFETIVTNERGEIISRWWFTRDISMVISSWFNNIKMRTKTKIGFWLLKGCADPCPHCNMLVDIGEWKKPEGLVVE